MKILLSLIKLQMNSNFGISSLKYRFTKEKGRIWEPILIALSILLGVGSLVVVYSLAMIGMFMAGKTIGHPEIILTMAFMAAQVVILVFGLFYILGAFYFSKDIEMLVPLPLKPYEVITGKFAVVMVNEYLTAFPFLLPPVLIYGIGMGEGVFYWIKALILILLAPAIPLIIGALFIMLLMRVVNLRRNKDLFAIIGGFAGLILALGINMFFQNIPYEKGTDYLQNLLASKYGLIEAIGSKFPPSIWATLGLSQPGLAGFAQFLLFVAVSLLMLVMMLWLSNQVFYKALLAGQEVSRKKKVLDGNEMRKQYERQSSPVMSIVAREWKLLLRTPLYVINGLTGVIMGPFMVIVLALTKAGARDQSGIEMMEAIKNPEYAVYVALGGLALALFTAGMNVVASTSVSREGQNFWIAKMIPVTGRAQVLAKFLQGFMISALGVIVTCIALVVFPGFPVTTLMMIILIGLLGSVPMVALSLAIDVLKPKLIWNTEQEAMKQNMNSMLGMLVALAVMVLMAVAAAIPLIIGMPQWSSFLATGAMAALLGAISMLVLVKLADRRYRTLEA
ncbi:MAG: hypothetical protein HGA22_00925 [Clostridiales bacterium]|nr:hypothetical protein [Clostridiales bacterium]